MIIFKDETEPMTDEAFKAKYGEPLFNSLKLWSEDPTAGWLHYGTLSFKHIEEK